MLIRCYKPLPAINCVQHKAEKKIVTEENIIQSNFNGFGNSVGSITNRATAMFSIQSQFDHNSKEYKELEYRILCTQLFQQNAHKLFSCYGLFLNQVLRNLIQNLSVFQ